MKSPAPLSVSASPRTDLAREENAAQIPARGGISLRVVVVCLFLALVFGTLSPIIDHKLFNTFLGATHLPPGAIAALLFLLLVVNPLLGLASRKFQFSQNETLTVYISCLFSALVPGHGAENLFVSNLLAPFYYASRENKWLATLLPNLPSWISPALSNGGGYDESGKRVVEGWYHGLASGEGIPWGAWLTPLAAWSGLILVSYVMLACLGVLLRAQWAGREALAFPLLRLPLEMTQQDSQNAPGAAFFRNPLMWSGFAVAVAIGTLNGLNFYFPDVPAIPLGIDTTRLLTEAPWNQIGKVDLRIWPMAVGITYLLTSEVSFSLWFFYWVFKLQFIAAYSLGYVPTILPSPVGWIGPATRTFASSQQIGAFFTFALLLMWTGREHGRHVARRAFGLAKATPDEKREALSYPVAFWGFVVSLIFILAWSVAAGVRLDIALLMWGSYLAVAIVLTRAVVEAGLLFVQPGWTPLGSLAQTVGTGGGVWLGASSLVPGSLIQGSLMTDLRAFLLPSFVQSFKLAHDRQIPARPLLALIFSCIALTFGLSVYQHIRLGYQSGGGLAFGHVWWVTKGATNSIVAARELTRETLPFSLTNSAYLVVGGIVTWALMLARSRLAWFPLHPVGYLVGLTGPINTFWFSIFLGWLCKGLITRFGGTDTYRKTTPLFLGLALGDVAMMVFWLLIDGGQGRTNHPLMPG